MEYELHFFLFYGKCRMTEVVTLGFDFLQGETYRNYDADWTRLEPGSAVPVATAGRLGFATAEKPLKRLRAFISAQVQVQRSCLPSSLRRSIIDGLRPRNLVGD